MKKSLAGAFQQSSAGSIFGLVMVFLSSFIGIIGLGTLNVLAKSMNQEKQTVEEFRLILKFEDRKVSFDDLLKYAVEVRDDATDERTRKALAKYVDILRAMERTKKDRDNEKDEVKRLIFSLRYQRDFGEFRADDRNSPAAKLMALGKKAVPYLIDELENDELSRSVSGERFMDGVAPPKLHVQRVGDCAAGILWKITGKKFTESPNIHEPGADLTAKEVRSMYLAWWKQQPK
jgi:hypothetical protein